MHEMKHLTGNDYFGFSDFYNGFLASLSVIVLSEIGDKTFFIAAIMSMKNSRLTVFNGAMSANILMTILSSLLGFVIILIPRWFTYYMSSLLFGIFGLKMLQEAYYMTSNEGLEEYEEAEERLKKREESGKKSLRSRRKDKTFFYKYFSKIFLQAFTLTFISEWGDRSQISTFLLSAREKIIGVIIGGCLGHALCTGLAVMTGKFVAEKISVKIITLIGGLVFIVFALSAFIDDHDKD